MMEDANDADDADYDDRLPLPTNMASSASRDYLTSREQKESQLLNLPEAAQCHMIHGHDLDLRQRSAAGIDNDGYDDDDDGDDDGDDDDVDDDDDCKIIEY